MKRNVIVTVIVILFYNIAYAIPPICPAVDMVKRAQLSNNTHDNYGTWNLSTVGTFGTAFAWNVLIGNIKADNLSEANSIAQNALSLIDKVSGPFLAQNHWVCKYTPEPVNGYYVIAWEINPANSYFLTLPKNR